MPQLCVETAIWSPCRVEVRLWPSLQLKRHKGENLLFFSFLSFVSLAVDHFMAWCIPTRQWLEGMMFNKYINIIIYIIYLLHYNWNPATASTNAKERDKKEREVRRGKKRKGIGAQRVKHPTQFRATDALIGDEEHNGKQKRTKRKKQGANSISPTEMNTYCHSM